MHHSEAIAQAVLQEHLRRNGLVDEADVAVERARALVAARALAELDSMDAEVRLVHEALALVGLVAAQGLDLDFEKAAVGDTVWTGTVSGDVDGVLEPTSGRARRRSSRLEVGVNGSGFGADRPPPVGPVPVR